MRLLCSITQSNSDIDRLFTTLSRALLAEWLILDNNEKTTLRINMPHWTHNFFIIINVVFYSYVYGFGTTVTGLFRGFSIFGAG